MRISKKSVDELKPRDKDTLVWDDTLKGFGVKVTPSGRKVFVVQFRLLGRSARYTIGPYGVWSPDRARSRALEVLGAVASGTDPRASVKAAQAAKTVADLCDQYFASACRQKKATTIQNERGKALRHIVPLLGKVQVSSLTRGMIQQFVNDVEGGKTAADVKTGPRGRARVTGGPGSANRTLGLLSSMLSFAVEIGERPDNPALGVKSFRLQRRDRYLRPDELGRLGEAIQNAEAQGVNANALNAIRFLLLSGCRKSEALGLQWSWIDFDRNVISLPDSKTGARPLQLGEAAKQLLKSLPRLDGSPFVFPSSRGSGPVVGLIKIWTQVRAQAGLEDVRLHDLRHNFASVAVSSGQSIYIVGKLLGHTQASTTQRYAHLADDPLRIAADDVSASISGLLAPPKRSSLDSDFAENSSKS